MGEGWAFTGGPPNASAGADVTLVEGRSFCVSDRVGDLGGAATHGLIVQDTRFVEHLVLTVDGDRLEPLGRRADRSARRHLRHPAQAPRRTRRQHPAGAAGALRGQRVVEDITLENLSRQSEEHTLALTVVDRLREPLRGQGGPGGHRARVTSTPPTESSARRPLHPAPRSVRITATGDPTTEDAAAQMAPRHPPSRARHHQRAHRALDRRDPAGRPPTRPASEHVDSVPASNTAHWRARSPPVALGRPQVRRAAANVHRRARGAAHHRPRPTRTASSSPRGAVVHDPLRARLAAHQLDAAPRSTPARPRAPCSRWPSARAAWSSRRPRRSPGASSTRSAPASSAPRARRRAPSTTAPSTRRPLFVMLVGELRRWGTPPARPRTAAAARRPRTRLDARPRRPRRRRVRRVRARHAARTGEPGVEGLLRRHHPRLGRAPARTHRARRGAGVRLRRAARAVRAAGRLRRPRACPASCGSRPMR